MLGVNTKRKTSKTTPLAPALLIPDRAETLSTLDIEQLAITTPAQPTGSTDSFVESSLIVQASATTISLLPQDPISLADTAISADDLDRATLFIGTSLLALSPVAFAKPSDAIDLIVGGAQRLLGNFSAQYNLYFNEDQTADVLKDVIATLNKDKPKELKSLVGDGSKRNPLLSLALLEDKSRPEKIVCFTMSGIGDYEHDFQVLLEQEKKGTFQSRSIGGKPKKTLEYYKQIEPFMHALLDVASTVLAKKSDDSYKIMIVAGYNLQIDEIISKIKPLIGLSSSHLNNQEIGNQKTRPCAEKPLFGVLYKLFKDNKRIRLISGAAEHIMPLKEGRRIAMSKKRKSMDDDAKETPTTQAKPLCDSCIANKLGYLCGLLLTKVDEIALSSDRDDQVLNRLLQYIESHLEERFLTFPSPIESRMLPAAPVDMDVSADKEKVALLNPYGLFTSAGESMPPTESEAQKRRRVAFGVGS